MKKNLTISGRVHIIPVRRSNNRYAGRYAAFFVPELYGAERPVTARYQAACCWVVRTLCVFFYWRKSVNTTTKEASNGGYHGEGTAGEIRAREKT